MSPSIEKISEYRHRQHAVHRALTHYQREYAIVALRLLNSLRDVGPFLALDAWDIRKDLEHFGTDPIEIAKKGRRTAWGIAGRLDDKAIRGSTLKKNDLIFSQPDANTIQVWLWDGRRARGGRKLELARDSGDVRRPSYELASSILEASDSEQLDKIIDRKSLTSTFFAEYASLRDQLADAIAQCEGDVDDAKQEAQRFLGRLMVVRFLERKGVLEGNREYLRDLFRNSRKKNFSRSLYKLFYDVLDQPEDSRKAPSNIPYLNGGLFERPAGAQLDLPNHLFDPEVKGAVLEVFYRYEFTLAEFADVSKEVAVDPSMFGLVLESLCDADQRKKRGVHYTPPAIASTLAREGLLRAIAKRCHVELDRLKLFASGHLESISEDESEEIRDTVLPAIKVVDPAVGSGSLLLATLNAMLELHRKLDRALGSDLRPGTKAWSDKARHYVQNCLYGVDIDADAIEVTKLRLWLAMTVGDDSKPRPLPDLARNIHVGDSLSGFRDVDAGNLESDRPRLEFDNLTRAENALAVALSTYQKAKGGEARDARRKLVQAERAFYVASQELEGVVESTEEWNGDEIPFRWHVHFRDVLKSENRGFDLVIANPPYVRVQSMSKQRLASYRSRFRALGRRNSDLYLAFVEQALELAGKRGEIAFIMPNFARTQAANPLRRLLEEKGAIDLWVDFDDVQVFPEATNYVALLFASSEKRRSKTFETRVVCKNEWKPDDEDWLNHFEVGECAYFDRWGHLEQAEAEDKLELASALQKHDQPKEVPAPRIWRVGAKTELNWADKYEKGTVPLGSLVEIHIGVQTSKDDIFLVQQIEDPKDGFVEVKSKVAKKPLRLEVEGLKRIAKGSKHIRQFCLTGNPVWCVWPYRPDGKLYEADTMSQQYPGIWSYLQKVEKVLRSRESGKFDKDKWWQFRRPQGVQVASKAGKLVVPSAMNSACAVPDWNGKLAFTASGTGGGGAWGIVLREDETRVSARWILACLNSSATWRWLQLEGDRKQNGWRGVDQGILRRLPVPIPSDKSNDAAYGITEEIESQLSAGKTENISKLMKQLDALFLRK